MVEAGSYRLSKWRPGFNPKSVHVRFVVDKAALGNITPISVSFHQCFILIN
jgi:hypothetical protein